jgi:hypothetical protein
VTIEFVHPTGQPEAVTRFNDSPLVPDQRINGAGERPLEPYFAQGGICFSTGPHHELFERRDSALCQHLYTDT